MENAWRSEIVAGYDLSIVKWAEKLDSVVAAIWTAVGIGLDVLTCGWLGWGAPVDEPRWSIQVQDQRTGEVWTVRTTFTLMGARHAARQVRPVLSSGDEQAISALLGV